MNDAIKLTEYSHGAGCGCKIAPNVLEKILSSQITPLEDPRLLVGNSSRDDAAVYDLGNGQAVISTTDFFMPVVDDPFDFGRIAATNAISDVYAMGGTPTLAIAILGWPVNRLPVEVAQQVVDGGRQACKDAGIVLAGGHSIDAPEPIFGLAVTGQVSIAQLKRNDTATAGCRLYLTKPLGVGILTTAQKKKRLQPEHQHIARDSMCQLNRIGAEISRLEGVKAVTDVTGFGLLGHLAEVCEGSGVGAEIDLARVPRLPEVERYLAQGCVPGGSERNYASYGHQVSALAPEQWQLLCDPQTSGGLLVAVAPEAEAAFLALTRGAGLDLAPIGELIDQPSGASPLIKVRGA
ncbi:selenide, water dikinase SelD [Motiliproteus sp. SC1-56]|uniref:selenide, water dikinase SelD n=1 Tax=Motiliproteus sp. SC1-56 TaxID=2799565 RepID=UPI001A8FDF2F|nr:selenide, water dikinase SelD [Motiliproteus sp. SC1-56]